VVTGRGIAAPNGLGADNYWSATLAGKSGIGLLTRFDAQGYPARLAGEVPGFVAEEHVPSRLIPQTDHMTRLALAATDWALRDAAIVPAELPEFDMGVVTSNSAGGFEFGQRELENLWSRGGEHVSAYQSFAWFYAVNTGQISIRNGMRGPSGVVVSEQAGGLDAIAHARRQIRRGTKIVISGGVEGTLCPWGWAAQLASGRISHSLEPDRAYLPFDPQACGYVPGEGGAIVVLEDETAARERGATRVYGEIAGYAATFDPRPGSDEEPGLRRAIQLSLVDAGISAADVDVVFADAAGLPELDRVEAEAINQVFGPDVAVTAPKTMTGRLYSGGGPLDVAAALLAIRDGVIPPTVNVSVDPRFPIDLVVGAPRVAATHTAVVIARGYGGFNSVLVVRARS
jgi:act minimal PKS chain-length factor (CLF/KS beta)